MKKLSESISAILCDQGIIPEQEAEACAYGLEVFMSSLLEVISILLIAVFAGNALETFVFFFAFIPLRIYAGGYHADTRIRCYIVSLAVYVLFTAVMTVLPQELYMPVCISEAVITLVIVLAKAPVIHHNKRVNESGVCRFRRVSVAVCLIQVILILLISVLFKGGRLITAFALGQSAESLSMIAAIIKNRIIGVDNK